ncbi:MAG: MBL fold metallo-hydrolase, partial [Promethearchaeota archaeon]
MSKITIVYENHPHPTRPELETGHGFAAVVELPHTKILFDTGWDGGMLLRNCKKLGVNLRDIDAIFISHGHWDHMGGLVWVLQDATPKNIYIPSDFSNFQPKEYARYVPDINVVRIGEGRILSELSSDISSTGTWKTTAPIGEHALILPHSTSQGNLLLVGCLHPGLRAFVSSAESELE